MAVYVQAVLHGRGVGGHIDGIDVISVTFAIFVQAVLGGRVAGGRTGVVAVSVQGVNIGGTLIWN